MLKEQLAAVQEIADKPDKQEKKIGASRKKVKLNAICEEWEQIESINDE